MTSVFFGAFQLRNRFSKALPSVAVAASALIGGASLLSGGQAKAFSCSFGGSTPPPAACAINVWHQSNPASDKLIKFLALPNAGSGTISFDYIDNPPPGLSIMDQWPVDVHFSPKLLHLNGPSTFNYLIKIDQTVPHLDGFRDVTLSGGVVGDAKLTKEIWSTDASGAPVSLLHTLISDPSHSVSDLHFDLSGPSAFNQLFIHDVADPGTVAGGGMIDSYQNTFTQQVPGPLPILGAGAAFGYTRKLRRRVKAMRLA